MKSSERRGKSAAFVRVWYNSATVDDTNYTVTDLPDFFARDGFTVKRAVPRDAAVLAQMINRAFAYQDEAKGASRTDEREIREKMTDRHFYIWTKDDEPAACVYLKELTITTYFGLFSITADYRGSGLAGAIMDAIEKFALARGKRQLRLDYMSLAPWLGEYYGRYGFETSGVVRDIGWAKLIRMQKPIAG